MFFTITTILLFIILSYFHYLFYLYKKKRKIILLLSIIPILYIIYIFQFYKLKGFSCVNWEKGFNNSFIDNYSKNYPCHIKIPKPHTCYLDEIGPFIDFTKLYRPTCFDQNLLKSEKEILFNDFKKIKNFNNRKNNYFGYPITNNDNKDPNDFGTICLSLKENFFDYINNNVILMELYKKKHSNKISEPEILINLNNNLGKLIIKIKKNETLIKEREEIIKKRKKKYIYKNILVMFFDTLSRVHFHRKFKKTGKFLNQFFKYEPNSKKQNLTAFEFFKYHSLNIYTDPNIKAAYYGPSLKNKKLTHFANYFKNNGFIIGRTNTYCEKEVVFNKNKKYIHAQWDHEGLSIACISAFYNGVLITKKYSMIKKCLFGKQLFEYSLEYLESFWTTYINQNKLFLFQSLDAHEPTGEVIGHLDEIVYNFLNKFYSNGWLKDTAILFFSDHGQHLNGPLYLTKSEDFKIERTLPSFFLILSNNEKLYKNNLYETLKVNQQVFITPFDIYNTLIHLAFADNSIYVRKYYNKYGKSLFSKMNYKIRFCQSDLYNSKIRICNCYKT